jgi:CRISPR associated protein Cas1
MRRRGFQDRFRTPRNPSGGARGCQASSCAGSGSHIRSRFAHTRELIRQKLTGQELVARNKLLDTTTADAIARFSAELPTAENVASIRLIEAQAASKYWSAWRTLPLIFPKKDLPRVPEHWRSFGTRISPLTGSPRLAVTPACAMMNYAYALLESEASLAARSVGIGRFDGNISCRSAQSR